MALDTKSIVTLGYWNDVGTELTIRMSTFGYIGNTLGPVVGGFIRKATYTSIALLGRMRL